LGVIKVQRSNLKQPTSRIPRIGTKPYARPAAAGKSAIDKNIKAPTATARKVATAREPPVCFPGQLLLFFHPETGS
jgi:hypothetical protein